MKKSEKVQKSTLPALKVGNFGFFVFFIKIYNSKSRQNLIILQKNEKIVKSFKENTFFLKKVTFFSINFFYKFYEIFYKKSRKRDFQNPHQNAA